MAQYRKDTWRYLGDNKTLFEVVMLADQYGNMVGPANPSGMAVDAFGRARSSEPFTLFDSFHRFQDNGRISQFTSGAANTVHDPNSSIINCNIGTTVGDKVYRESSRVFAYQPGKSLQILQTFVFAPKKDGLRQRYGYFGERNGIFLEVANNDVFLVERSSSTGVITEKRVRQSEWNIDVMDGTGPSGITLDLSKAQIMFTDIEWLGLGTVRSGFVIDGKFIHCNSFHHANLFTTTYMGTACLPVRMEVENTANTASPSTTKIVCTSVISEGGYELRGRSFTVGLPLTTPKDIPIAGTFTPIISIRLKDDRSDAIVIPTDVEFFGVGNNTRYNWKVVVGGTLTGAAWANVASDSSVEYDTSATAITGGRSLTQGFVNVASGAGGQTTNLKTADVFSYQLERNPFSANNKGTVFSLVATGAASGDDALGSISWQEIT